METDVDLRCRLLVELARLHELMAETFRQTFNPTGAVCRIGDVFFR